MADIRIRVGASLYRSVNVVFAQLSDQAKKARAQIAAEMNAAGDAMAAGARRGAKSRERVEKDSMRERLRTASSTA